LVLIGDRRNVKSWLGLSEQLSSVTILTGAATRAVRNAVDSSSRKNRAAGAICRPRPAAKETAGEAPPRTPIAAQA
jgi:hypothetical protein